MRPTTIYRSLLRFPLRGCRTYFTGEASSRQNTYGFIGTGRMGACMATNLFSKRHLVDPNARFLIHDAFPAAAERAIESIKEQHRGINIAFAFTPAEVVASAGSIVTMLPSTNEVNIVYRQDGGIISGFNSLSEHERQTTFCIDSTTLDVQSAIDVATSVKNMGAEMVDAPVSGGVAGAKAGTLTFLVGGTEVGFNRAKTMLVDMGARIVHVGPSGAGLAAKIVNNMILGVQQFAVAEGMLLGKQLGLDPAVLADVVNSSTGACWSSSINNPAPGALKGTGKTPPCENGYQGGFATALMLKDMKLADTAGGDLDLPVARYVLQAYENMIQQRPELKDRDFSSSYSFLEKK